MRVPLPPIGRHWWPLGAQRCHDIPKMGTLVAWHYAVWRVVEVRDIPQVNWEEGDDLEGYKPEYREKMRPRGLRMRPVEIDPHDLKQTNRDVHIKFGGRNHHLSLPVFPDLHYPVCASCGGPVPCREKDIQDELERAEKRSRRYEMAWVCPSCAEPVTQRQKSITFEDNIEVPLGPPVTFHLRWECHDGALRYEQQWAAEDPEHRRTTLSCAGSATAHNDGTYECTEFDRCPGPTARHHGYQQCRCPDCHARGHFNCYPAPDATLLDRRTPGEGS